VGGVIGFILLVSLFLWWRERSHHPHHDYHHTNQPYPQHSYL
jgi:hypothetical protein